MKKKNKDGQLQLFKLKYLTAVLNSKTNNERRNKSTPSNGIAKFISSQG